MRKLRTPLLNAGDLTFIEVIITAKGASQTDLEGKQLNDSRVGALDKSSHKAEFGLRL
jgi:hypothetical protein